MVETLGKSSSRSKSKSRMAMSLRTLRRTKCSISLSNFASQWKTCTIKELFIVISNRAIFSWRKIMCWNWVILGWQLGWVANQRQARWLEPRNIFHQRWSRAKDMGFKLMFGRSACSPMNSQLSDIHSLVQVWVSFSKR